MSNRIVHFEIHADDPERAAAFYTKMFGWEIKKWDSLEMEYWMVMTAPQDSKEPGINGGLIRRPKECLPTVPKQAVTGFVCTILVENIDETIAKLEAEGAICAVPKMSIAGMAWQAYYLDTEKNIFGIHQPLRTLSRF
jgi:predicted enzyme related to lactoylglutathione lyase